MHSYLRIPVGMIALTMVLAGCGGGNGANTTGILSATPTITSISPTQAVPGGTITIVGTNLTSTNTIVYFSGAINAQAYASSGTTTSIVVTVPTTLTAGNYNVSVVGTDGDGDTSAASNSMAISLL